MSTSLGYGPGAAEWIARGPFLTEAPVTLQVQSVLYRLSPEAVVRSLRSLARAVELTVLPTGAPLTVTVAYGDCSELPVFDEAGLQALREEFADHFEISYTWFDANLGFAAGNNRLVGEPTDFLLLMNPDVVLAPRLLEILFHTFLKPGIGIAEAKQLPIEHLKDYDRSTGETSWASLACALIPRQVWDAVGGLDEQSFFLYCEDVDFSWSVRQAGLRVIYQPAASVFHDKRVDAEAQWVPTSSERYYSAETALFLTHKWSRQDLTEKYLTFFRASDDEGLKKAAAVFDKARAEGRLVPQVDPEHRIGVFTEDGNFARTRKSVSA